MIRDTSIRTYLNEIAPTLGARQIAVLEAFENSTDEDMTNMEIAKNIEREINTVTPRVHELRQYGILVESRLRPCRVTGRMAHAWKIGEKPALLPKAIHPAPVIHQLPSRSQPGRTHTIKDTGRIVTCTCRAFYWRRTCSHIKHLAKQPPKPQEHMSALF